MQEESSAAIRVFRVVCVVRVLKSLNWNVDDAANADNTEENDVFQSVLDSKGLR